MTPFGGGEATRITLSPTLSQALSAGTENPVRLSAGIVKTPLAPATMTRLSRPAPPTTSVNALAAPKLMLAWTCSPAFDPNTSRSIETSALGTKNPCGLINPVEVRMGVATARTSIVSIPVPPSKVSTAVKVSSMNRSSPMPPDSVSLPSPPVMVSLPSLPLMMSLPAKPLMMSGPVVPFSVSLPLVPSIDIPCLP